MAERHAVRFEYCRIASVSETTPNPARVRSGCAISRTPAPFTSTAREMVTKWRTGFACAIFYRRQLTHSFRNFFMAGVVPFLGGAILTGIFVKAFIDYNKVENTYSGKFAGFGVPVAIGVGLLLLGVVVMVIANFASPQFFRRKPETADPGILEGTAKGEASVMSD